MSADHAVRLQQFQGPLDLLLYLIRRAEIDITEISLAEITDQYLRHIESVAEIDVELAGEFLVMAATLLEIKSRLVGPGKAQPESNETSPARTEAEAEPAAVLIRQLLEYKVYRDAAEALDDRRTEWAMRFAVAGLSTALPEPDDAEVCELDLEDARLIDLVHAFRRIIETVEVGRLGDHQVKYDDTPIELHAEDILDRLRRESTVEGRPASMPLRRIFEGRTRGEMIGLFIALLELCRRRAILVTQESLSGDIVMTLQEGEDDPVSLSGHDEA